MFKNKRALFLLLLVGSMIFSFHADAMAKTRWKVIDEGLEYTSQNISSGVIHAFRIDPARYKLGVVTAKEFGTKTAPVKSMAVKRGALVAVNGGFFTPELESLGLLVNEGKVLNPVKNTSWWSVFSMKDGWPSISHTSSFQLDPSVSMAIQSGPRLLVDGAIPSQLKPSLAERSAVCITSEKKIVLIATEALLIDPKDLAARLKRSEAEDGFGCESALNLDGGSSTQMYAKIGSFELDSPGINTVTNALVVYRK